MSVTCAHGETVDFYHLGNWFLPPGKFIFTIVETFYYHRKDIVNVWFHLNSLLWSPSMVNHPIIWIPDLENQVENLMMACQLSQPSSNNFSKPPIIIKRRLNVTFSRLFNKKHSTKSLYTWIGQLLSCAHYNTCKQRINRCIHWSILLGLVHCKPVLSLARGVL